MKELTELKSEREGQPTISKCVEEIRQELEKFDCQSNDRWFYC